MYHRVRHSQHTLRKIIEQEQMKDKESLRFVKLKWMIISAVFMVVIGAALMIAGFIVPPIGEIHPSVLTAIGECLTFAGSLFGINATYRIKTERISYNNTKE